MGKSSSDTSGSSYSYTASSSSSSDSSRSSRRSRRRRGEKKSRDRSRDRKDKDRHRDTRRRESSRDRDRRRDKSRDRKDRDRKDKSSSKKRYPTRPPPGTYCHACKRAGHWTVECDAVRSDPSRFSHINVRDGCPICGKVGHRYNRCTSIKFSCRSCGDLHDTRECPFDYEPVEYHEFYDETKGFPYFYCCKTQAITWMFTGNAHLDKLLWHCDHCKILLPNNVSECVQCHGTRRVRKASRVHKKDGIERSSKENYEAIDGLSFAAITGWVDETKTVADMMQRLAEAVAAADGNPVDVHSLDMPAGHIGNDENRRSGESDYDDVAPPDVPMSLTADALKFFQ